jgi:hypothetical protein
MTIPVELQLALRILDAGEVIDMDISSAARELYSAGNLEFGGAAEDIGDDLRVARQAVVNRLISANECLAEGFEEDACDEWQAAREYYEIMTDAIYGRLVRCESAWLEDRVPTLRLESGDTGWHVSLVSSDGRILG